MTTVNNTTTNATETNAAAAEETVTLEVLFQNIAERVTIKGGDTRASFIEELAVVSKDFCIGEAEERYLIESLSSEEFGFSKEEAMAITAAAKKLADDETKAEEQDGSSLETPFYKNTGYIAAATALVVGGAMQAKRGISIGGMVGTVAAAGISYYGAKLATKEIESESLAIAMAVGLGGTVGGVFATGGGAVQKRFFSAAEETAVTEEGAVVETVQLVEQSDEMAA